MALFWRALRFLKRSVLIALAPFEHALLSAAWRERIHATATFSLIFLFAVSSVDFLVNGAIEFGTPAQAQPQRVVLRAAYDAARAETEAPQVSEAAEAAPTALSPALAEAHGANVTLVSQSFPVQQMSDIPLEAPREDLIALGAPVDDSAELSSADQTQAADVSPDLAPAPGKRVKPQRAGRA